MPEEAADSIVSDSEISLPILLNQLFEQYDELHNYSSFLCAAFESLIFHMNHHTDFLDEASPQGATICCQTLQRQSNEIKEKIEHIKKTMGTEGRPKD
ncbi:hypothetical protein MNBD_GAMMA26-1715 [hydrothermal vent metagenome]|uniref:Uncharacterized protein n=1 Tax=hydrothermal vent metagenome TaxID=652676 RepID=A0A3B1B9I0_9ZZZZ